MTQKPMAIDGSAIREDGPVTQIGNRVDGINGNLFNAVQKLESILSRLEGPYPADVSGSNKTEPPASLLGAINEHLDTNNSCSEKILQLVNQIDSIVR